jgi:hypothetical protein
MVALALILANALFKIVKLIAAEGLVEGGALYLIKVMVIVVPAG